MNKFTFYPVGQGLFYVGQLNSDQSKDSGNRFCFMYDCGSESKNLYLEKAIDCFVSETKNIDLCVISHLHRDHYNGLSLLKEKGIFIKNILLPYLPKAQNYSALKLVYIVGQYCYKYEKNTYDNRDIENLGLILNLYGIPISGDEHASGFHDIRVRFLENIDKTEVKTETQFLISKNEFTAPNTYWVYELYNKTITEKKWQNFNLKLKEYLDNKHLDINDVFMFFPQNIKELVEIYKAVFGANFNATSIIMRHYSPEKTYGYYPADTTPFNSFIVTHSSNNMVAFEKSNKNISVLTGDAEFDDYLNSKVLENSSSISVLQIPHHGAKTNWSKVSLPNDMKCKMVASFGLGNQYSHPSPSVVEDILKMDDCEFVSVNQSEQYEYWIEHR